MSLRRIDRTTATLAAGLLTLLVGAGSASAQAANTGTPVSGKGKGIVGGALLGGEVVDLTMGAIGVEKGWPYLVFGGVGAIGGALGGFAVEKGSATEPPLYMLAGGMALIIPTLVVSLNATAYKPPETDKSEPVTNEPATTPPQPKAGVQVTTSREAPRIHLRAARAERPMIHVPLSLFDVYRGQLALGVPAFEVRPLYTQREMWTYGVAQGQEIHMPIFKAMF